MVKAGYRTWFTLFLPPRTLPPLENRWIRSKSIPCGIAVAFAIDSDDAGSTKTEIMLKRILRDRLNLSFLRMSAKLPDKFSALRKSSGAERMPL